MNRRQLVAAIVVAIWVLLIAWFVKWHSAPPPVPNTPVPGGAASP
jgi:hypothetical protein